MLRIVLYIQVSLLYSSTYDMTILPTINYPVQWGNLRDTFVGNELM